MYNLLYIPQITNHLFNKHISLIYNLLYIPQITNHLLHVYNLKISSTQYTKYYKPLI